MEEDKIINLSELVQTYGIKEVYKNKIACFKVECDFAHLSAIQPVCTNTYSVIIVQSGTAVFLFNGKREEVGEGCMLLLYPSLMVSLIHKSPDFAGWHLICECGLFEHLLASHPAYKYYALFFYAKDSPVLHLSAGQQESIVFSMQHISRCISEHYAYQEDILVYLMNVCLMQILELLDARTTMPSPGLNHAEDIFLKYIELLAKYYRKEHYIDFYAQQLAISSAYLSRIVRQVTGRTVNFFHSGVLYVEACRLLIYTDMTVQAIADKLCFSDQSAFGKFFKSKSGISPALYRKRLYKK